MTASSTASVYILNSFFIFDFAAILAIQVSLLENFGMTVSCHIYVRCLYAYIYIYIYILCFIYILIEANASCCLL